MVSCFSRAESLPRLAGYCVLGALQKTGENWGKTGKTGRGKTGENWGKTGKTAGKTGEKLGKTVFLGEKKTSRAD